MKVIISSNLIFHSYFSVSGQIPYKTGTVFVAQPLLSSSLATTPHPILPLEVCTIAIIKLLIYTPSSKFHIFTYKIYTFEKGSYAAHKNF